MIRAHLTRTSDFMRATHRIRLKLHRTKTSTITHRAATKALSFPLLLPLYSPATYNSTAELSSALNPLPHSWAFLVFSRAYLCIYFISYFLPLAYIHLLSFATVLSGALPRRIFFLAGGMSSGHQPRMSLSTTARTVFPELESGHMATPGSADNS